MADIFISHADEEKDLAGAVERLLRKELGSDTSVFLSSNIFTLVGGENFEQRIREEIRSCKAFVALFSGKSFERHWVHVECGGAWGLGKPVIPVCYGDKKIVDLPRPYSSFMAVDLATDPYRLVIAIAKALGAPPPPPPGVWLTGPNFTPGFPYAGAYEPVGKALKRLYPKETV